MGRDDTIEIDCGSQGNKCLCLCAISVWIIVPFCVFIVYLTIGLESAMIGHEGMLASGTIVKDSCGSSRDTEGGCTYHIDERFLYSNGTHHCTVSHDSQSFSESRAQTALQKLAINSTRELWMRPGTTNICYDGSNLRMNFNIAMVCIAISVLPIVFLWWLSCFQGEDMFGGLCCCCSGCFECLSNCLSGCCSCNWIKYGGCRGDETNEKSGVDGIENGGVEFVASGNGTGTGDCDANGGDNQPDEQPNNEEDLVVSPDSISI